LKLSSDLITVEENIMIEGEKDKMKGRKKE
jgi:hypothetical protein